MLKKNHSRTISKISVWLISNAVVMLVVFLIVHIIRYQQSLTPEGEHGFELYSGAEFLKSCSEWPTFASIIITSFFGFSSAFVIGRVAKNVKDTKWVTSELKDATDELVSQARYALTDFKDVLIKACDMLKKVDEVTGSEVKLALFWPMFGADLGDKFATDELISERDFVDIAENPFYHYLFRRFQYNLPTELLFLDYKKNGDQSPKLFHFIDVLSDYTRDPDRISFSSKSQKVKNIKEKVVAHINKNLISRSRSDDHGHIKIKTTDDLPLLLFIVKNKQKPTRDGLLFISNVHMMHKNNDHGGFYTQKPEMVDVLDGLFISLFESGTEI